MMKNTAVCLLWVSALFAVAQAYIAAPLLTPRSRGASTVMMSGADDAFKNMMRSARKPGPNDRVVELRKPLGIILEEDERGNVYVKDLQAGGNAARSGKVKVGDMISMISATFGDECWSARGAGLGMIMQAIKVRQGQSVKIVLEGNNESADKKSRAAQTAAQAKAAQDAAKKKEADLLREIEEEDKGKKKFFGLF